MTRIRAATVFAAVLLAAGTTAAMAAPINLVTNGGFEDGSTGGYDPATNQFLGAPTGWTFTPASKGSNAFIGLYANSGMYGFQFEATGGKDDELSQVLATTPGASYTISFYAYSLDFSFRRRDNNLMVDFGSETVFSQSFSGYNPYTEFTVSGTATGTSTDLQIFGRNAFAVNAIDDISVTAAASPVPEPTTLALLGAGLLGMGLIRRRRA